MSSVQWPTELWVVASVSRHWSGLVPVCRHGGTMDLKTSPRFHGAAAHLENVLISFVCFFNLIIKCCLHMDRGKACFYSPIPLPPWPACLPGE